MDNPMMKCGCAANAEATRRDGRELNPPLPCCAIHDCIEIAETKPSLEGRKACCSYGKHRIVDSSWSLAFFEYHGPGSPSAEHQCVCGYTESAHQLEPIGTATYEIRCRNFVARGPSQYDRYYCGCRGWD